MYVNGLSLLKKKSVIANNRPYPNPSPKNFILYNNTAVIVIIVTCLVVAIAVYDDI